MVCLVAIIIRRDLDVTVFTAVVYDIFGRVRIAAPRISYRTFATIPLLSKSWLFGTVTRLVLLGRGVSRFNVDQTLPSFAYFYNYSICRHCYCNNNVKRSTRTIVIVQGAYFITHGVALLTLYNTDNFFQNTFSSSSKIPSPFGEVRFSKGIEFLKLTGEKWRVRIELKRNRD